MDRTRHLIILLVDDDPDDRENFKEGLRLAGSDCQITEAVDGSQALELLQEMKTKGNLPCLIVVDINMPKVNGKELVAAIQADEPLSSIPLVVLTTSTSTLDKLFFDKKHVEMIEKPYEMKNLVSIASKLLGYCKGRHERKK